MAKGFFKNLILSIITISMIFMLAEIISVIVYSFQKKDLKNAQVAASTEKPYYIPHPVMGWYPSPGYDGTRVCTGNKHYHTTVNSVGMRDREVPAQKGSDTVRILCMGDSITDGPGVDNDQTYPRIFERLLNSGPHKVTYEVFNCGVGDYCTEQEALYLREIGLQFKPDVVVVGYYLNDGRGYTPELTINSGAPILKILRKSRFVSYLNAIILKYRIKAEYRVWNKNRFKWEDVYKAGAWKNSKEDLRSLITSADRDWGAAWTDKGWVNVKKGMDMFLRMKQKQGFRLIVLNFPMVLQVYPGPSDEYLYMPQRQLKEYCDKNGIEYLDLIPYIKGYKQEEMFEDACHYTPLGLQVVAKALNSYFRK